MRLDGARESGRFHKAARLIERGEQRLDLAPQAFVAGASRGEPDLALCALALKRRLKQFLDSLPSFSLHPPLLDQARPPHSERKDWLPIREFLRALRGLFN